ncbi:hypothetical protein [Glutamicibacter sp.]|uniref:hypothetical protein n=1 Tax=Glutamicibacter sp. TaxID=1931995 RepID=UPI002FC709A7
MLDLQSNPDSSSQENNYQVGACPAQDAGPWNREAFRAALFHSSEACGLAEQDAEQSGGDERGQAFKGGSSPTGKVPNAPNAKSGKKAPPGLSPYRSAINELKAAQNIPPASSVHPRIPKGAMAIPQIPAHSISAAPSTWSFSRCERCGFRPYIPTMEPKTA